MKGKSGGSRPSGAEPTGFAFGKAPSLRLRFVAPWPRARSPPSAGEPPLGSPDKIAAAGIACLERTVAQPERWTDSSRRRR